MTIVIRRLRMSLIWSTPFAKLIGDNPPSDAPLSGLGKRDSYQQLLERLLAAPNEPIIPPPGTGPALELPWPPLGTHWFWCRYLNANRLSLRRLTGSFAFCRLVPLRRHDSPAPNLSATFEGTYVAPDEVTLESGLAEAWFHPHMASFAVHFTIRGAMSLKTAGRICLRLRRERVIAGAEPSPLNLDDLAGKKLDQLYIEAVGKANAGAVPPVNPFSLVTVLQGEGVDGNDPIIDGGPVHLFLETVTQWDAKKRDPVHMGRISSRPVHKPSNITGPLLFGRRRGRAVWDPNHFLPAGNGRSSLSCYHRNLIVSSLQTEALLAFAGLAAEQAAAGHRPKTIRDCEDAVLKRLIALHKAKPDDAGTYSSINLQRIIDGSPHRGSVDAIAARRNTGDRLPPP